MISHLHVRNFALIDELDISFNQGFSVITGETGAGKSILLGAIGLALGERADVKSALSASEKCVVELTVSLKGYGLEDMFDSLDLDYEEETILRREILPSGKSRAFVNDTPTVLSALQALSNRLVDIHSQNDTLLLRDDAFQLSLVDSLAGNEKERVEYLTAFKAHTQAEKAYQLLLDESTEGVDIDYLRFLYEELMEAKLESAEEENEIEEELNRLQHAEDILGNLSEASQIMEGQPGIADWLNNYEHQLQQGAKHDEAIREWLDRLNSVKIELADIHESVLLHAQSLEANPQRLQQLDDRMSHLQHLKKKHRVSTLGELIEEREALEVKLKRYDDLETHLKDAQQAIDKSKEEMNVAASELTKSRQTIIPSIEAKMNELLKHVNMGDAVFEMHMRQAQEYSSKGLDLIDWLFSANKGRSLQPISKVASGGELSRVMLALKSIMSKSKGLPTIIFDEIDTGISGETALRVAEILKEMGSVMQVVAISHLPQIASAGQVHYRVEKSADGGVTRTRIRPLSSEERVEEISRMLSGVKGSEAAIANAKELLGQAAK